MVGIVDEGGEVRKGGPLDDVMGGHPALTFASFQRARFDGPERGGMAVAHGAEELLRSRYGLQGVCSRKGAVMVKDCFDRCFRSFA